MSLGPPRELTPYIQVFYREMMTEGMYWRCQYEFDNRTGKNCGLGGRAKHKYYEDVCREVMTDKGAETELYENIYHAAI